METARNATFDMFGGPSWTQRNMSTLDYKELDRDPSIMSEPDSDTPWFEDKRTDPDSFFCIHDPLVEEPGKTRPMQRLIRGREFFEDILQLSLKDLDLQISSRRYLHFMYPKKPYVGVIPPDCWMTFHDANEIEVDVCRGEEQEWRPLVESWERFGLKNISVVLSTETLFLSRGTMEGAFIVWDQLHCLMLYKDFWRWKK